MNSIINAKNIIPKNKTDLFRVGKVNVFFCNPPYGSTIKDWVKKCAESDAELVVMLIPARTDTKYFHEYIYNKSEIRFIKGRLKFGN